MASATTSAFTLPSTRTLALTHSGVPVPAVAATATLTLTGNAVDTQTVTIGAKVYTFVDALTEAPASQTLTLSGNAVAGETVTVGSITYTFVTALTGQTYEVLIGAEATDSLDNLIAAIQRGTTERGDRGGEGTLYGFGTFEHPLVSAAAGSGDTMDITALTAGVAGNSIATTETMTNGSWGAATMADGAAAVLNEVLIGAEATDSLDNLIAAVNATPTGAGTLYATGTLASTEVSAAAGAGDTAVFTALAAGTAGNSLASTETLANGSFGATTFAGGAAATTATSTSMNVIRDGHGNISFNDGTKVVVFHGGDVGLTALFEALDGLPATT